MEFKEQKIYTINPEVDNNSISGSQYIQCEAEVEEVDGVSDSDFSGSDFKTAEKAARAIVGTGINPLAVSRGLSEGHGYPTRQIKALVRFERTEPKAGVIKLRPDEVIPYDLVPIKSNIPVIRGQVPEELARIARIRSKRLPKLEKAA